MSDSVPTTETRNDSINAKGPTGTLKSRPGSVLLEAAVAQESLATIT